MALLIPNGFFTLWLLTYLTSFGGSSIPPSSASASASNHNHIFNALHSTLRQWDESLHHNGVSFFLATIPAGTRLYHGRGDTELLGDGVMEWLALEPEHASNFAVRVERNGSEPDLSPKWGWTWQQVQVQEQEPSQGQDWVHGRGPAAMGEEMRLVPLHALSSSAAGGCASEASSADQRLLLGQPQPRPPPQNDYKLYPGYLHTYTATRDLRLLYIDGQSAAKSPIGTLSSQDLILLRHSSKRPKGLFGESARARGLCELAANEWGRSIDGVVRMEHGFEVIACDFGVVRRMGVVEKWRLGLDFWHFLTAVADRYGGVGDGRVRVRTERFVSVYADPEMGRLWQDSEDGVLPNISRISDTAAERVAGQVRELVMSGRLPGEVEENGRRQEVDWREISDLYVTRYARRLQYLSEREAWASAEARANATQAVYGVYLDGADYETHDSRPAIQRCTEAFIPPAQLDLPWEEQSMAQQSVTNVACEICTVLYSVMTILAGDFEEQQMRLDGLKEWLQWPAFKVCDEGRGCRVDEVCFVAIWPWGGKEDHEEPRCWDREALARRTGLGGYWRMGEAR
ncbi:uncharacterized protein HMPREF1541_01671 [Cyphellophora europaea CBS 101466]|uniref:Uncharacterized protein n=1 Tax=Cyphellophora europaea (strain CBS 101466) TaxID=1220924 RepID=W2S3J9_CYPE1|nr:uncharacterized protein HMPREF1541_01671 [Cyphellophora europaea CBS 101466]ETN42514.1 hypothetical protein HMPREF1541_01671 [Cyphellophora europaea CBS 101466]